MASNAGTATKRDGTSTITKNIKSVMPFLEDAIGELLSFLSATGQTFLTGILSLGPNNLIVTNTKLESAINMALTKTSGPASPMWFLINIGPWTNTPATIIVAPVSERDLAKAKVKEAINECFRIGNVTVLSAVSGAAPKVLAACSYSSL